MVKKSGDREREKFVSNSPRNLWSFLYTHIAAEKLGIDEKNITSVVVCSGQGFHLLKLVSLKVGNKVKRRYEYALEPWLLYDSMLKVS